MTYRILCKCVSLVAYDYFFKSCIRPKVLSLVWYVIYNVVFWTTNNVYIQGIHAIVFHQTLPASNSSKSPHCTLSYYRASKPLANYKSLRFGIIVYGQFFWKFHRYANPLSINIVVGFNHKQRGIARTHARERANIKHSLKWYKANGQQEKHREHLFVLLCFHVRRLIKKNTPTIRLLGMWAMEQSKLSLAKSSKEKEERRRQLKVKDKKHSS